MTIEQLRRFIAPLNRRVMSIVRRAIIQTTTETYALGRAQVETLKDVVQDDIERLQEYGFASRPKAGAEGVLLNLGGNGDHAVIIATEDSRYRIKILKEGEVAIYTDEGDRIHLKRGNAIDIVTKTLNIQAETKVSITTPILEASTSTSTKFTTPTLETTAALKIGSAITATSLKADTVSDAKGSMDQIRSTYNTHTHPETGQATQAPSQPMT